ncbi:MAG: nucleotidyltransferase domain-containing protein [Asgard group archaeon]|nr:nucleotidyltransferase domain-containing protein [Asgard group archaeon]
MTNINQEKHITVFNETLKHQMTPLFNDYGVSFAYLSGSYARGQQSVLSDIDIFVSLPFLNTITTEELLNLMSDFSRKASEVTKLEKIEISILERIPLHVQFQAIKEGILLFEESQDRRIMYIENLLKFYYDHKIWYQNYLNQAVEG